jgi:hypothetical protein
MLSKLRIAILIFLSSCLVLKAEDWKSRRIIAANKTRRIIYNNDGNDDPTPVTVLNFLNKRTSGLANSQVDTIFYCDGVFNLYTHQSDESEFLDNIATASEPNWAVQLCEQGYEPLQLIIDWCQDNDREIFWSMRMNDCHDAWSSYSHLWTEWKENHRDLLMASNETSFTYGWEWTCLNYEHEQVRDKVYNIIYDVCTRYDVNGIELDFFRFLSYFTETMYGEPVQQYQCDLLTDLLARVRQLTDSIADQRGYPFLIAIRVPDSLIYCRELGLDIVRWIESDLIDLIVAAGDFRVESWEKINAFATRYEVPVYACLDHGRIPVEIHGDVDVEAWRAEAFYAWSENVAGMYTFNMFYDDHSILDEIGNFGALETLSKDFQYDLSSENEYIISYIQKLNGWSNILSKEMIKERYSFLFDGKDYLRVPTDYSTISSAINAAGGEDEIWVRANHIEGPVELSIDKNISIVSCDYYYNEIMKGAQIYNDDSGDGNSCIKILSDSKLEIYGFEIQNCQSGSSSAIYSKGGMYMNDCNVLSDSSGKLLELHNTLGGEYKIEYSEFLQGSSDPIMSTTSPNSITNDIVFTNCLFKYGVISYPGKVFDSTLNNSWNFRHCTVILSDQSEGFSGSGGSFEISNSIISDLGYSAVALNASNVSIESHHNLLDCGTNYSGNVQNKEGDILDVSPGFVDSGSGDFSINSTSICVDKADRSIIPAVVHDKPFFIRDSTPDIGCYEFVKSSLTVEIHSDVNNVDEPNGVAVITFSRSGDLQQQVYINIQLGGQALDNIDYVLSDYNVVFDSGQDSTQVYLQVLPDSESELTEDVTVEILHGTDYILGNEKSVKIDILNKPTCFQEVFMKGGFVADLNNDCVVDLQDLVLFSDKWLDSY